MEEIERGGGARGKIALTKVADEDEVTRVAKKESSLVSEKLMARKRKKSLSDADAAAAAVGVREGRRKRRRRSNVEMIHSSRSKQNFLLFLLFLLLLVEGNFSTLLLLQS